MFGMNDIQYIASCRLKDGSVIFNDPYYNDEDKAIQASNKLAKEYNGEPFVDTIDWRD